MSDDGDKILELDDIPTPRVKTSRRVSLVWLVPLVAGLIGVGLAVQAFMEKGPTITIEFASAEGLEAGKTRIKYKDVDVGRVETIQLDRKLAHVKVTASMVPEIESHLTASTRFWIVRARIGNGEVSGLETLFSGVHIAMEPGSQGKEESHFVGLEKPPVVTQDTAGTYFKMRAAKLGSIDIGAPVYFRQINVGQVVDYAMEPRGTGINVKVFIRSPHDRRVNQNTRFWNASGLDVTVDPNGVRIDTQSILTLLQGGIAFETSIQLGEGGEVDPDKHIFTLFASYDKISEPTFAHKVHFLAYFDGTIRGLTVGAPVEFRGIKIGEVIDLKLQFNTNDDSFRIPVLCSIEPDRIEPIGDNAQLGSGKSAETDMIARLVAKGLRAQLRTGVLLTGQLYINLDIYPDAESAAMGFAGDYPILPTVPEPVQEIAGSLTGLLNRLEKLPIEQIGEDLQETIHHAKQLIGSRDLAEAAVSLNKSMGQLQQFTAGLNSDLSPRISDLLEQSRNTMAKGQGALSAAEKVLNAEAPLTHELNQTLKELARAARAVSALAELLERNPQSLIYGKGDSQ
ncbi:MAG: MlaD family protein [Desulfobacteraceae bacterium]|jgi:paraquat-inducible protein B